MKNVSKYFCFFFSSSRNSQQTRSQARAATFITLHCFLSLSLYFSFLFLICNKFLAQIDFMLQLIEFKSCWYLWCQLVTSLLQFLFIVQLHTFDWRNSINRIHRFSRPPECCHCLKLLLISMKLVNMFNCFAIHPRDTRTWSIELLAFNAPITIFQLTGPSCCWNWKV